MGHMYKQHKVGRMVIFINFVWVWRSLGLNARYRNCPEKIVCPPCSIVKFERSRMYFRTSSRIPTVVIIDSNDGVVLIRTSLIKPFTSACLLLWLNTDGPQLLTHGSSI
jgi:hypothetical protein